MFSNPDQIYVQSAKQFCTTIDCEIKKYLTNNRFIEEKRKEKDNRTKILSGSKMILAFFLIMLALLIPFVLISIFTTALFMYALPPVAIAITIGFKVYYQKKIVPIHETEYARIVSLANEDVHNAIKELSEYKCIYESETSRIPDRLRHDMVFNILQESIRQGYAENLNDAISFYKAHLEAIEHDKTEAALQILSEIEESEKQIDERLKVFSVIEQ